MYDNEKEEIKKIFNEIREKKLKREDIKLKEKNRTIGVQQMSAEDL